MPAAIKPYRIFPLGDAAITVDFGNIINEAINQKVLNLFYQLRDNPLPGMIEAVPAYSSLTIYYNVFDVSKRVTGGKPVFEFMSAQMEECLDKPLAEAIIPSRLISIPVCYEREFAPDIDYMAKEKNISIEELIDIHSSRQYRVYMLGFMPGFSYMGEVDEKISIHRKPKPVPVAAGSVGIAGRQTGIYPLASPGGWQIIGRTPLRLFETSPQTFLPKSYGSSTKERAFEETFCLLHPGDTVQFTSISKNEFENY
jgi:inhibitor of KinA